MSCDLIRVDFKSKYVKSRTSLKEAEYDPTKCPQFSMFMDAAHAMALDAFKAGVHPQRLVLVLADPENNYSSAVYDPERIDMQDAVEGLDYMIGKLVRTLNEQSDDS